MARPAPLPASLDRAVEMAEDNAVIVALGAGGFATLQAALASIADASSDKIYRIRAVADPAGYDMRDVVWKDHVELEGEGDTPVLFRCELPADADPLAVAYAQPVHQAERARFRNIHVRAKNCRYPLILGDAAASEAGNTVDCLFEHLGNDEVCAYQAANNNDFSFIGSQQRIGTAPARASAIA